MPSIYSDAELIQKAIFFGKNALLWRRKFMGLLPEIDRRKAFLLKGFSSIFEFAFKVCGLSEAQVRQVLSLEKHFERTPLLQDLLRTGRVSVHKLSRIASIANLENEEALAQAVKVLPKSAIETLVRDERAAKGSDPKGLNSTNTLFKTSTPEKPFVPGHNLANTSELKLSVETTRRLLELQNKGIDINQVLSELLDQRDREIVEEKEAIARELIEKRSAQEKPKRSERLVKSSRYIPVRIKKILNKEYGTKCAIPKCNKTSAEIHHTQTFTLSQEHDPHYLAPLCKEHHLIAHSINLKLHEKRRDYQNEGLTKHHEREFG